MGCFLAMDDVELLERGIVNKSGGRMSKQINAIDFVPDANGRMKKFDANCLPKISKPATRNLNSNQVVNPYCDKSEVVIDNVDCFSTEQLRRRIRSLSPARKKNKVRRSRTLGTIQCEVGSADESAVLEYTVSQDSRTYTLKGNGQDAAGQQITLEFGALRSFLNYVSRDNSVGNKKSDRNIGAAKRH
uniref:Uncharacterized protein n=1 Tax=Ditylenchus dipsaci TaxID=166011 RepID=A0A915E5V8_9BILA